jgi:hypothetical protein
MSDPRVAKLNPGLELENAFSVKIPLTVMTTGLQPPGSNQLTPTA